MVGGESISKRLPGPEAQAGMEWHRLWSPGVPGVPTALLLVALAGLGHLGLMVLFQNLPSTRRPPRLC